MIGMVVRGTYVVVVGATVVLLMPPLRAAGQSSAGAPKAPAGAERTPVKSVAIKRLPDGTRVSQEIFVPGSSSAVAVSWRLLSGAGPITLEVRPFLSGRDYHALHHENPEFRFEPVETPHRMLRFQPYGDLPAVFVRTNGAFCVWACLTRRTSAA